jgi:hypothetical protein
MFHIEARCVTLASGPASNLEVGTSEPEDMILVVKFTSPLGTESIWSPGCVRGGSIAIAEPCSVVGLMSGG